MVCGQRKYFLCDLRDLGVSLLIFSRLFACFAGSISEGQTGNLVCGMTKIAGEA